VNWTGHRLALSKVREIIGFLPPDAQWGITITDEDDASSPAALNITVYSFTDFQNACGSMQLHLSTWPTLDFQDEKGSPVKCWREDHLEVSITYEKEPTSAPDRAA
jgi:hypothetical protein